MIIQPVERADGFYEFGDASDDTKDVWAAYYDESGSDIVADLQITIDPAYYIEGAIQEGWSGLGSDTSREELITELESRGFNVIQ